MNPLFNHIQELHVRMRELTLATGLEAEKYDFIIQVTDDLTEEQLQARYDFLATVHSAEYLDLVRIWREVPPEVWARYESYGLRNSFECVTLREKQKTLRMKWRKFIRKISHVKKKPNPVDVADQADSSAVSI